MKATPKQTTHYQKQDCKFLIPSDGLEIYFGYKDEDSLTIQLRGEGTEIYIGRYMRYKLYPNSIRGVTVPLQLFLDNIDDVISFLEAKLATETPKNVTNGN